MHEDHDLCTVLRGPMALTHIDTKALADRIDALHREKAEAKAAGIAEGRRLEMENDFRQGFQAGNAYARDVYWHNYAIGADEAWRIYSAGKEPSR